MEQLPAWTRRGVRRCPFCKEANGQRASSCRNERCGRSLPQKHTHRGGSDCAPVSAVRLHSERGVCSVRAVASGPDYRGFVRTGVNTALCHVRTCALYRHNTSERCPHVTAALDTQLTAKILPIDRLALDSLDVSADTKHRIWNRTLNRQRPLVQRVTKQVMVVATDESVYHPLGYLHVMFSLNKNKYFCSCKNHPNRFENTIKSGNDVEKNKKCFHYYACLSAFVSNPLLFDEFKCFLDEYLLDLSLHLSSENLDTNLYGDPSIMESNSTMGLNNDSSILLDIDNDSTSPITTKTIELNDGNTLMMEFMTEADSEAPMEEDADNTLKVELNDIIFVKSHDDLLNMYNIITDDSSILTKGWKPSDIKIVLTDSNAEADEDKNESVESADKNVDCLLNLHSIDANENFNDIMIEKKEISLLAEDCNSLEIISIDEYNYKIDQEEITIEDNVKKSNNFNQKDRFDSLTSIDDDELLLLDLNKPSDCLLSRSPLINSLNFIQNMTKSNTSKTIKTDTKSTSNVRKLPMSDTNIIEHNRNTSDINDFSFNTWLSSVTERINHAMHFQIKVKHNVHSYFIPENFFEKLQSRMSLDPQKQRLPNSISELNNINNFPCGKFTKYIWNITSIETVKRIFDNPDVPMEIIQFFKQRPDGTYEKVDRSHCCNITEKPIDDLKGFNENPIATKLCPGILVTYLMVGSYDSIKNLTPFVVEWIPSVLPKSRVGELKLTFKHERKSNFVIR